MTERPILFSGQMVRSILAGKKTQTRRIIKPVRGYEHNDIMKHGMPYAADPWAVWWHSAVTDRVGCLQKCPYGKPGDRLWVRETWRVFKKYDEDRPSFLHSEPEMAGLTYEADRYSNSNSGRLRAPIHMPRWASRITLEITDVRVERLAEISCDDALAEGVADTSFWREARPGDDVSIDGEYQCSFIIDCYRRLWEHINGADSLAADPFVWAISFRVIQPEVRP